MPTWDPHQYLQFAEERTLPCRDLVRRIELTAPANIIDLGCGPGNSTTVIAGRWPNAAVTGLDGSTEMIAAARRSQPKNNWIVGNITSWRKGIVIRSTWSVPTPRCNGWTITGQRSRI